MAGDEGEGMCVREGGEEGDEDIREKHVGKPDL